jgi:hypothetical protein
MAGTVAIPAPADQGLDRAVLFWQSGARQERDKVANDCRCVLN